MQANRFSSKVRGIVALIASSLLLTPSLASQAAAPDYTKRAGTLDPSLRNALVGKWTNPGDKLIIEIDSVDLTSGRIEGSVMPTSGPAAADGHELIGWVSAAPVREGQDNVNPISFSTTLYEYGTLPAWAGFLKDGTIVTMHYLVWPNKAYSWDHFSANSETWTKLP